LPVSFIGAIFGTALPGPGSIYLNQSAEFKAPVFLGDTITVRAEVVALDKRIPKVTLKTTIKNQNGILVVDGQGEILFKPVPEKPKA
jgi:3-hydroxybutyryl-CoA dehydratase